MTGRRLLIPTVFLLPLLPLPGCAALADGAAPCDRTAEHSATVDAEGAALLRVAASAGSLEIRGEEGLATVEVAGTACASDTGLLEEVRLEARREGDEVRIRARLPDTDGGERAALDLEIRVPEGMDLQAEDSSGPVTIRAVGSVELTDGSGPVTLIRAGEVKIVDGSGDLDVREVRSLEISDGSGPIRVRRVAGPLAIDDGSGSIEVDGVTGEVDLSDGSGSLLLRRVTGSVRISDGSGDLRVEEIEGAVELSDGSGDVVVSGVGGDLRIRGSGSGDLEVENIAGRVTIR